MPVEYQKEYGMGYPMYKLWTLEVKVLHYLSYNIKLLCVIKEQEKLFYYPFYRCGN